MACKAGFFWCFVSFLQTQSLQFETVQYENFKPQSS